MTTTIRVQSERSDPMSRAPSRGRGQRGQILVIATLAMIAMVAGGALVLEGGNAAAQQRASQNGADAAANAGATVLAENLAGNVRTDGQVLARVNVVAAQNGLGSPGGWYTNFSGQMLSPAGLVVTDPATAAAVGDGVIPSGARGVRIHGTRTFGTTLGRVIGFDTISASAEATAITGPLTGGQFLPVVFPINIVDCETNGDLGTGEDKWTLSQPGDPPVGQEYIVPLCKTGGGSFMVLDLDGTKNNCDDEVANAVTVQWDTFPVYVDSDNGNNCAKPLADEVNKLRGKVVLVPVCDDECVTSNGSNAQYHIVKVAAFYLDFMEDSNDPNNSVCSGNGTTLIPIAGNGSSSCLGGWFVRYITVGPVGGGPVGASDALGIQLIR